MTSPYPEGWFAILASDEIRPGEVAAARLMNEDAMLYRTDARVYETYCPHLDTHLGHGGCIDGEDHLVCLFHAFAYDKQGACARTGGGDRPRRVSLGHRRPAHEVNGLLYMWHRHAGSPPA